MATSNMKLKATTVAILGGSAVALAAFCGYKFWYRRRFSQDLDEGFDENSRLAENLESRVLVLGLDDAGKSAVLSCLGNSQSLSPPKPTEGFNVISLQTAKGTINIWEIGGASHVRQYWSNFIQDTDLLVYVVDSSDESRFADTSRELHALLCDERLQEVPTIVLANKQDKQGAKSPEELRERLNLNIIPPKKHEIRIIATSVLLKKGVDETEKLIFSLCKKL